MQPQLLIKCSVHLFEHDPNLIQKATAFVRVNVRQYSLFVFYKESEYMQKQHHIMSLHSSVLYVNLLYVKLRFSFYLNHEMYISGSVRYIKKIKKSE